MEPTDFPSEQPQSYTSFDTFTTDKNQQEARLESALFGQEDITTGSILDPLLGDDSESTSSWANINFDKQIETNAKKQKTEHGETDIATAEIDVIFESTERKAAWDDEDDDANVVDISTVARSRKLRLDEDETVISGKEYNKRLREQFAHTTKGSSWADLPAEAQEQTLAEKVTSSILSSSESLTYQGSGREICAAVGLAELPKGHIDIVRLPNANKGETSQFNITSAKFHPNGELFMTAGMDKTIRLYQIDCENNPKVQGVTIADLPIMCAAFNGDGTEVIATGRRKYFYVYDLAHGAVTQVPGVNGREEKSLEIFKVSPSGEFMAIIGNDGYVMLLSMRTKQLIGNLRCSTLVADISFSHDSKYLYTVGKDGNVYIWDVASRRCVDRFRDEGTVHGSCVSTSWDGKYIATGSDSGVANVYTTSRDDILDLGDGMGERKEPVKALLPLTTTISKLTWSKSNEILAMASRQKKDAVRLVHIPSMTVFENWPTANTPLGNVQDIDFSPHSGMISIANANGKVLLYRLTHYQSS